MSRDHPSFPPLRIKESKKKLVVFNSYFFSLIASHKTRVGIVLKVKMTETLSDLY